MVEVVGCGNCGEQLPTVFAGKMKEFLVECPRCGMMYRIKRDERGKVAYITPIYPFADDQGESEQKQA